MTAPAGSTVVTPLTTLVQAAMDSGHSLLEANAAIRTALDLPAGINILTYDPMRILASSTATAQQRSDAMDVLKTSLQVSNIISQSGNAIIATDGDLARDEARDVAEALATTLYARGSAGATFDLGSGRNLVDLLGEVNTGGAWGTYVESLATITAASNNAVGAAQNLVDLSKSAVITQNAVPEAIAQGITSLTLGTTVTNYTGANLDTRMAAAEPGFVTPGVTASMADALTVVGVPPASMA
jgi:small ligand-binding sensory domain FIST